MTAEFQIAANDIVRFSVMPDARSQLPKQVTYRHSCCPLGWGTIYELGLDRVDPQRNVVVYKILRSRSEKP